METILHNSVAVIVLDALLLAVNWITHSSKPLRLGAGFKNGKQRVIQNSATLDVQQRSTLRAFSIAAVLHTIAVRASRRPGVSDERNLVGASRGRCIVRHDVRDVGIKGVKSAATGRLIRAVADADSSDPTPEPQDGTATRNGMQVRVYPNPCKGLAAPMTI